MKIYYPNGNKYKYFWYKNNEIHREDDLPAHIEYYNNEQNNKSIEAWYINGEYHRDNDLPAEIDYNENGKTIMESWFISGYRHRITDNPSVIEYYDNGKKSVEIYFRNNSKHRINGPAEITYNQNQIIREYYIYGRPITNVKYFKMIRCIRKYVNNQLEFKRKKLLIKLCNAGLKKYTKDIMKIITDFS